MTLHLLQIFLTDGLTFILSSHAWKMNAVRQPNAKESICPEIKKNNTAAIILLFFLSLGRQLLRLCFRPIQCIYQLFYKNPLTDLCNLHKL